MYSGSSQNSAPEVGAVQPTVWHEPSTPVGLPTPFGGGDITDGNVLGLFSGESGDQPIVASESAGTQALPINFSFGFANAISRDGSIVVGTDSGVPTFWKATDIDNLQYEIQNTLATPPDGVLAGRLLEIVEDPQFGQIAFGEYFELSTGAQAVGAWDLSDSSFIRGFGSETSFADARIFEDTLVVAFNDPVDGFLDSLFDADPLSMAELTGETMFIESGSLYEGSIGFVASGSSGTKAVSYELLISFPDGDYDRNGDVDGADYLEWQQQYGSYLTRGSGADGNGNGVVDAADYAVWRDHYGATAAGLSQATVPEPSTMLLMVCATLLSCLHRWR